MQNTLLSNFCSSTCIQIIILWSALPTYNRNFHSAQGKGLYRLGSGCFTFVPLASITSTSDEAIALIARQRRKIEDKIKSGTLPPGLKEQYELQLAGFESGKGGDCELIVFPGSYRGRGSETFPTSSALFITFPFCTKPRNRANRISQFWLL